MADTITYTETLDLLAAFSDEDDRTISIADPKPSITSAQIDALEVLAAPVLVGDKYSASFTRFKEAKIIKKTTRKFDIS